MRGNGFPHLNLLPALVLMILAGCATSPPQPTVDYKQDYQFGKIRSIAFLPQSGGSSGDSPRAFLSDMVSDRIDTGLANALRNKGIKVVDDPSQADAWISWHLVAQEKTDIRTYNTGPTFGTYYGGYRGYNRAAYYNCWNCGTDVRVRQYTQGTFIVDIIDPERKQSVWRSAACSRRFPPRVSRPCRLTAGRREYPAGYSCPPRP